MSANIMATSRDSGKSLAFTVRLVSSMMTVTTCGRTSGPRKRNGSLRMCSNMPVRCTPGPRKQSKSTTERKKDETHITTCPVPLTAAAASRTAIVNHAIPDNHLNPHSTRCDSIVRSDVTTSCMRCMMSQHAVTACHCDACCDSEMSVLS